MSRARPVPDDDEVAVSLGGDGRKALSERRVRVDLELGAERVLRHTTSGDGYQNTPRETEMIECASSAHHRACRRP